MSEEKKKDNDGTLEQEARVALLQHFSSKSTNQTTIILTVVLAFFAFFQTLQLTKDWPEWTRNLYDSLVLTSLVFIALRACGRLIFWGKLAGLILVIKPLDEKIVKQKIESSEKESTEKVTCFNRLVAGMESRIKESRVVIIFDAMTNTIEGGPLLFLLLGLCWGLVFTSNILQIALVPLVVFLLILVLRRICHTIKKGEFEEGVKS